MTLEQYSITAVTPFDFGDWLRLGIALWPHHAEDLRPSFEASLASPKEHALISRTTDAEAVGFANLSLRSDYVPGTRSSPAGYLAGIYVAPEHRRRGVARLLVDASERWARSQGCTDFASDALLDNVESHAFHRALGFRETQRTVFFAKAIGR